MKTMAFGHRLTFPPPIQILRPLPLAINSKMDLRSLEFADVVELTTS